MYMKFHLKHICEIISVLLLSFGRISTKPKIPEDKYNPTICTAKQQLPTSMPDLLQIH